MSRDHLQDAITAVSSVMYSYAECTVSSAVAQSKFAISAQYNPTPPKDKGMFTEIAKDIKGFILEYRGILYFIAIALIVDEFIFKGVFRSRLQSIADKIVKKVEDKLS